VAVVSLLLLWRYGSLPLGQKNLDTLKKVEGGKKG
jgi:hypothetical protein